MGYAERELILRVPLKIFPMLVESHYRFDCSRKLYLIGVFTDKRQRNYVFFSLFHFDVELWCDNATKFLF